MNNVAIKKPDSREVMDAVFRAEGEIAKLPQVELEYVHRFTPGLYTREMRAPAGIIMTGAIHLTEHISIFLEGRMLVPDENGKTVEIAAPMVETAQPGIKRIGVVLEDVRWITVHPTELTDVDAILEQIVTNDPEEAQRIIGSSGGMIEQQEKEQ